MCSFLAHPVVLVSCHFFTDNSLQSADKDQQESRVVAETYIARARYRCKIRYMSKFTAASRGPPCDSMAFFYYLVHLVF